MLRASEQLYGYTIVAADGLIGRVHDFLFEDNTWFVRYLVVDTGTWLPGRRVLIAPESIAPDAADWPSRTLSVLLTRQQVKDSPEISTDAPVSREMEAKLRHYYNWPPYWGGGLFVGGTAGYYPEQAITPQEREKMSGATVAEEETQNHLRSTKEVSGYKIAATDGQIGHLDHFIFDDEDWLIRYLVCATSDWLPGKRVLVSPDWVSDISWAEARVHIELSKSEIEGAPEFDSREPVNRVYEERLYDYYGRPAYWRRT
jgi:hypothetical protein